MAFTHSTPCRFTLQFKVRKNRAHFLDKTFFPQLPNQHYYVLYWISWFVISDFEIFLDASKYFAFKNSTSSIMILFIITFPTLHINMYLWINKQITHHILIGSNKHVHVQKNQILWPENLAGSVLEMDCMKKVFFKSSMC